MKPHNKKSLSGLSGTLAIIGAIAGIIIFVTTVFGEWYADFDIEPVGLITGILTIAVFLLPFAVSVIAGGGTGFIAGGFLGVIIELAIAAIVSFIKNAIDAARRRKKRKIASRGIRKANKNISKVVAELTQLRKEVPVSETSIVSSYNLCCLLSTIADNKSTFKMCVDKCSCNYEKLRRIRKLESQVQKLAEEYSIIGDHKNASYYRSIARK